MYFLLSLLISIQANASEYDKAIEVTSKAVLIQSGYQADIDRINNAATAWVKAKGLTGVLTVGSITYRLVKDRRLEIHTGNFTFKGTDDVKQLDFRIGF